MNIMKTKYEKIRISGGSGSGKTYLGERLEKITGIKFIALDNIFYDFSKTHRFDTKKSSVERKRLLKQILKKKQWIIDGGYYKVGKETYDEADLLIFLRPIFLKRILNTIKRYFTRCKNGKGEGFFNFLSLTSYNFKSRKKWQTKRVILFKKEYEDKLQMFNSADEAYEWFVKQ